MGAYLSEPVTEKISSDETGKHISYGAASMQGWRMNQEDAHNCVVDYDEGDTSFFAVYDGHGGAEVAKYCAMQLPEFIKSLPSYKEGKLETALSEGFLKFDATLVTPEGLMKLKALTDNSTDGDLTGAESTEEDEAGMLEAEADMPIEKVLARYGTKLGVKRGAGKGDEEDDSDGKEEEKETKLVNGDSSALGENEHAEAKSSLARSSPSKESASKVEPGSPSALSALPEEQPASCTKEPSSNASESKDGDGGEGSSGASGEKSRLCRSKPYAALIMDEEISDSSEDSTESSQGDEEEDAEEEENDDDEEGDTDENNAWDLIKKRRLAQQDALACLDVDAVGAGYDSGCTAVVGVLKGHKLVVANAGDSRCVVCRSGKAVDMSVDHKPEDKTELQRIKKAGGEVSDGRVNGGLNLSRAIGDHTYKCNKDLGPEEQMITALPDIRTLDISPETDKFMVLACDGIWNSMSSDEVVDFVAEKLREGVTPLSKICEMIFDACLAPDVTGDGTGCDNMTCIVVQFHESPSEEDQKKRSASTNGEEEEDNPKKKSRTEEPVPSEG